MPMFRDEHVIIIAPGSHITLAQLGLPESFTPARLRLKTRMFPAQKKGEWEPNKIRKKPKKPSHAFAPALSHLDEGQSALPKPASVEQEDDGSEYEEDVLSDEGAVWPLQLGAITNWSCFYALMHHIHNLLNAPFHTPILIIGQPCWTAKDHENITQFFFEKFKTPGFAIIDSAQAACYAFGVLTATVVDIGADKADITTVVESLVDDIGRARALQRCGGESMTRRLHHLLSPRGFTRDMCEQLKKSSICEILPAGMPIPGSAEAKDSSSIAATVAATTANSQKQGALGSIPRGSLPESEKLDDVEANDGVIDVATIVARGNTTEFLAKKEAEKQEKLAAKKKSGDSTAATATTAKPLKQRNFEREKNSFFYDDYAALDAIKGSDMDAAQMAEVVSSIDDEHKRVGAEETAESHSAEVVNATATAQQNPEAGQGIHAVPRRELFVGPERFQAAEDDLLTNLSSAIHRTILANPNPARRADLWDSLIILGNGARVRGLKEALLATLTARFLISPSSATIFTSELPSSFSTPNATNGTNTPQPGQMPLPPPTGVNPLLYAATTASAAQQQQQQQQQQHQHNHNHTSHSSQQLHPPHTPHHPGQTASFASPSAQHTSMQQQSPLPLTPQTHTGHSQTPTSIRAARLPEYFPEWKEAGTEEAAFLGAQVAAKVVFVNDVAGSATSSTKGFMSRSDYNESGPSGIHEFSLS